MDLFYLEYQNHIEIHNNPERKTIIDKRNGAFFTVLYENGNTQTPYLTFKDMRDNFWMSLNHKEITINKTSYDLQNLNEHILTDYFTLIQTIQEQILSKAEKYFLQFCNPDYNVIIQSKLNFTDVKQEKTLKYNLFEFPEISTN